MSDQVGLLRRLPTFRGLAEKEIDTVFERMEETLLPPGMVLFEQGAAASVLYVVWTGSIEIYQARPAGGHKLLATLKTGDCLGEMGLLRNTTRSASARAATESLVMALKKEELDALAREHTKIWGRMMANLAVQLANRLEEIERAFAEHEAAAKPANPQQVRGLLSRLLGW